MAEGSPKLLPFWKPLPCDPPGSLGEQIWRECQPPHPRGPGIFPSGGPHPACLLSSLGSYPCSPGPPWCPCPLLMSPPPTALLCSSRLPLWETPQTECWNTCLMPPFRTSVSPHVQPGTGTRSYFLGSAMPLMPWASWPSAVSGSVRPCHRQECALVQGSTPPDVLSPHRGPTCR